MECIFALILLKEIYQNVNWASLVVQWLRIRLPMLAGVGSIPGWGAKIPHAAQPKKCFSKVIFMYY